MFPRVELNGVVLQIGVTRGGRRAGFVETQLRRLRMPTDLDGAASHISMANVGPVSCGPDLLGVYPNAMVCCGKHMAVTFCRFHDEVVLQEKLMMW